MGVRTSWSFGLACGRDACVRATADDPSQGEAEKELDWQERQKQRGQGEHQGSFL
jgi:hypothetical protein